MSKHLVNLIYAKVCGSAMRKAVLVALADRANDDGSGVYVSKTRIAAEIECNRSTVIETCKQLEDASLIHAVGRKAGNHGYTIIYQISVAKIQELPDAWVKCRNSDTLDSSLGEDDEALAGTTLGKVQVSKSARPSVGGTDKNRPYRTIDKNPSEKKNGASHRKTPSDEAALMLWEARRVRASGDHERADEMERQANEMLLEDTKAKAETEH